MQSNLMELQIIQNKIVELRGMRVMLDYDLAEMYQVETKYLKRSVKRNIERFPEDFMFELTKNECDSLRCNFGTLENIGRGQYAKYLPFAFTEQGVAQLSSVLNSSIAIQVNISIIRAFVAIRNYLMQQSTTSHEIEKLWTHVKSLEQQTEENLKVVNDLNDDTQNTFDEIYIALSELARKEQVINTKPRKRVGYVQDEEGEH